MPPRPPLVHPYGVCRLDNEAMLIFHPYCYYILQSTFAVKKTSSLGKQICLTLRKTVNILKFSECYENVAECTE